jgi:hypothetical protein
VSRRFELHADTPVAKPPRVAIAVSGLVAEGVEFADGTVVVR